MDERQGATVISLPVGEVKRLTGVAHSPERIAELLTHGWLPSLRVLVMVVFTVTAPSWRPDLTAARRPGRRGRTPRRLRQHPRCYARPSQRATA